MPSDAFRGTSQGGLDPSRAFGSITIEETSVTGAGGYHSPHLIFPATVDLFSPPLISLYGVRGTVVLPDESDDDYIATLSEVRETVFQSIGRAQRVLHAQLTPAVIEHIEVKRAGKDLRLRLRLLCGAFGFVSEDAPPQGEGEKTSIWQSGRRKHPDGLGECFANLDLTIPRSIWVDNVLPRVGYMQTRLVELVTPAQEQLAPAFESAIKELSDAERAFERGSYGEVVTKCRNALIAITTAFKLDLGQGDETAKAQFSNRVRAFKEQWLVPAVGETQADLTAALLSSLWRPLSAPTKPGAREATRENAMLNLHVTSALIGFIGKVLA